MFANTDDDAAQPPSQDQPAEQAESSRGPSAHLNRSCENCRKSKLRCVVDGKNAACRRCLATQRSCEFLSPKVRRRRKVPTDTRVAELERQLRDLRMQLDCRGPPDAVADALPSSSCASSVSAAMEIGAGPVAAVSTATSAAPSVRFKAPVTPASWPHRKTNISAVATASAPGERVRQSNDSLMLQDTATGTPDSGVTDLNMPADDVVARNVLTWERAEELATLYFTDFAPNAPFVVLPTMPSVQAIRAQRPATFLAILTASSVTADQQLNLALHRELSTLLARRIVLDGEHTSDLVHAVIILTIWYAPERQFESLRRHHFAHLAAAIVEDNQPTNHADHPTRDLNLREAHVEEMDWHKTFLTIYFLCMALSSITGRPSTLVFSPKHLASIAWLKAQPELTYVDRWFIAWLDLQQLAASATRLLYPDRHAVDLDIPGYQVHVESFCHQLDAWENNSEIELGGVLRQHGHHARLLILGICLHKDHVASDLRPPFRVRALHAHMSLPPLLLTPFYVRTVMALIKAAQDILDVFLHFNNINHLGCPGVYFLRTCHALVVLLIIDMSTRRAGSELPKILDANMLRVAGYLQGVINILSEAQHLPRHSMPARLLVTATQMETWWLTQVHNPSPSDADFVTALNPENARPAFDSQQPQAPSPSTPPIAPPTRSYTDYAAPQPAIPDSVGFPSAPNFSTDEHPSMNAPHGVPPPPSSQGLAIDPISLIPSDWLLDYGEMEHYPHMAGLEWPVSQIAPPRQPEMPDER